MSNTISRFNLNFPTQLSNDYDNSINWRLLRVRVQLNFIKCQYRVRYFPTTKKKLIQCQCLFLLINYWMCWWKNYFSATNWIMDNFHFTPFFQCANENAPSDNFSVNPANVFPWCIRAMASPTVSMEVTRTRSNALTRVSVDLMISSFFMLAMTEIDSNQFS